MKKIYKANIFILNLILAFLVITPLIAQSEVNNIWSEKNCLAFGNHLFAEKDYLRAIGEFQSVLINNWNDTLQFKIASSYLQMRQYDKAFYEFNKFVPNSSLQILIENEKFRILYFEEKYSELQNAIEKPTTNSGNNSIELLRLINSSMLLNDVKLPEKSKFISVYSNEDKNEATKFYNWKENTPYKNPTKAAILSSIIPGLGKIYANEIGDGITSFVLTGIFTYLAVNKFKNNQQTSALIYTTFATFFYSGNIYGSFTAVQNYNASIKFNFENEVKIFVNDRNQFLTTPTFMCD